MCCSPSAFTLPYTDTSVAPSSTSSIHFILCFLRLGLICAITTNPVATAVTTKQEVNTIDPVSDITIYRARQKSSP